MIASVETDVFALDLAPAAKLGRGSSFLSPGLKNPAKKLAAPKFRGQQGDKREKVKVLKYLFTISYRLSLFSASQVRIKIVKIRHKFVKMGHVFK